MNNMTNASIAKAILVAATAGIERAVVEEVTGQNLPYNGASAYINESTFTACVDVYLCDDEDVPVWMVETSVDGTSDGIQQLNGESLTDAMAWLVKTAKEG